MAREKRKHRTLSQDARPTEPTWRRPPARARKKMRRMTATVQPVAKQPKKSGPSARPPNRLGLRLPARAVALDVARRVLVLALAAGLTYGMMQLLRLPQLTVSATSTQIGGAQRITPEQVYSASGIEGRNIFLIRPAAVAALIGQIGGIKAAQVHVRLPNQVLIDVWEHTPLVAWQGITTTLWLAADGSSVPQAGIDPPLRLIDQTTIAPTADSPLATLLLKDLAAFHAVRPDVTELYYGKNQGLNFRTPEGWSVWLGDSGTLTDKLALLEVARQEIIRLGEQVEVIDLRHSNRRAIWW